MTMDPRLDNYDWEEVFKYTGDPSNPITREVLHGVSYGREDVAEIIAMDDGENDGPDWIGAFKMTDGRYLLVRAGCDYTGWDCQAGGSAEWTATLDELKAIATPEDRDRFGWS